MATVKTKTKKKKFNNTLTTIQEKITAFLKNHKEFDYQITDIARGIDVEYHVVKAAMISIIQRKIVMQTRTTGNNMMMYQLPEWMTNERKKELVKFRKTSDKTLAKRREETIDRITRNKQSSSDDIKQEQEQNKN